MQQTGIRISALGLLSTLPACLSAPRTSTTAGDAQLREQLAEIRTDLEAAVVRLDTSAGRDVNDPWPGRIAAIGREAAYLGGGLLGLLLLRVPVTRWVLRHLNRPAKGNP